MDQVLAGMRGRESRLQLGFNPFGRRMKSDVEMDDFPFVVADDEETVKLSEKERGHGE